MNINTKEYKEELAHFFRFSRSMYEHCELSVFYKKLGNKEDCLSPTILPITSLRLFST